MLILTVEKFGIISAAYAILVSNIIYFFSLSFIAMHYEYKFTKNELIVKRENKDEASF